MVDVAESERLLGRRRDMLRSYMTAGDRCRIDGMLCGEARWWWFVMRSDGRPALPFIPLRTVAGEPLLGS
ncbi:hypothetical protein BD311DRAFT_745072, partial [Dichomitus squalens]